MSSEISHEEALALFREWKDRNCRVFVAFNSPDAFRGQLDGRILAVEEEMLLVGVFGANTNIHLSTRECKFVVPDVVGDEHALAGAESTLMLCFPDKITCSIITFAVPN